MKSRAWIVAAVAAACCVGWFGRSVLGDEPPKPPAGGPDMAKQMEEMMKMMAKPGEQHARLIKALEGEWTIKGTAHEMDGSTSESTGTATFKSILGGRFIAQEVKATSTKMGPFEGRGIMGYENATKQFVHSWCDDMGTGFYTGTGQETEPGKAWTFKSKMNTPMGEMTARDEMKVTGDKTFTFTMYMSFAPGQPESPMMTLTYTRK